MLVTFPDLSMLKLKLYHACVLSILLYCSPVWFANVARWLENLNKRALIWVNGKHSYASNLSTLRQLPVCYMLLVNDICFLWKVIHGKLDITLPVDFTFDGSPTYTTRSGAFALFKVRRSKKFGTDTAFFARSCLTANELTIRKVIDMRWPQCKVKLALRIYLKDLTLILRFRQLLTFYIPCHCAIYRSWPLPCLLYLLEHSERNLSPFLSLSYVSLVLIHHREVGINDMGKRH